MSLINLQIQFGDISIKGPPQREMTFEVILSHSYGFNLIPIYSDVSLRLQGWDVIRGSFLEYSRPRVDPAVIPPGEPTYGKFRFPMKLEALHWVEEYRKGKDLDYVLTPIIRAFVQDPETKVLTGPFDCHGELRGNTQIAGRIPQSDWVRYLNQLGFSESVLVELPVFANNSRFPAAKGRFDEATEHLRRGEWDAAMASCRKMFEALAASKTTDLTTRPDLRLLRNFFDATPKGDALNHIVEALTELLHLARHEQGLESGVLMTALDAHAAVVFSGELLRYCERAP
jgi:hypothetical protein